MKIDTFKALFVKRIPENLVPGIIYVSKTYKCVQHLCPCGCGNKIITPIGKNAWNIEVHDDGTISLSPSVGNFYLPCRSHYYIKHGKIKLC